MDTRRHLKITSTQNPRIKSLVALKKKRERDRSGLMLIEGVRELTLALQSGIVIEELYYQPGLTGSRDGLRLMKELEYRRIPMTAVGPRVFEKIAYRETSGGFVAVAGKHTISLQDMPEEENPLYLVVDSVEKPGNLGAILRSADAVKVTGLILCDMKTDLYNPNVIRASIGTVFTVPVASAASDEAASWLKGRGTAIITSTPGGEIEYTNADFRSPSAIVVGSEDRGAGDVWLEYSDRRIRIPMKGKADSLNVSAAATILLYEALRQRRGGGAG